MREVHPSLGVQKFYWVSHNGIQHPMTDPNSSDSIPATTAKRDIHHKSHGLSKMVHASKGLRQINIRQNIPRTRRLSLKRQPTSLEYEVLEQPSPAGLHFLTVKHEQ